jgi:putative transposase
MNKPKCTEYDYINFLVAAQRVFSALEAARTQPYGEHRPAHDAALACKGHTRLLQRLPADSEGLWAEVRCVPVSVWTWGCWS